MEDYTKLYRLAHKNYIILFIYPLRTYPSRLFLFHFRLIIWYCYWKPNIPSDQIYFVHPLYITSCFDIAKEKRKGGKIEYTRKQKNKGNKPNLDTYLRVNSLWGIHEYCVKSRRSRKMGIEDKVNLLDTDKGTNFDT